MIAMILYEKEWYPYAPYSLPVMNLDWILYIADQTYMKQRANCPEMSFQCFYKDTEYVV